jgi:hypothetical protein
MGKNIIKNKIFKWFNIYEVKILFFLKIDLMDDEEPVLMELANSLSNFLEYMREKVKFK